MSPADAAAASGPLLRILEEARSAGFLGPGPVEAQLAHAAQFLRVVEDLGRPPPANFCDLGTGGGVPGLVLAVGWPATTGVLIESARRRAAFLRSALAVLDVDGRVGVVEARAEEVARDPDHREHFEIVTARSFAPSPVTAEIAAGLVRPGGVVVVSEPPAEVPDRWPAGPLDDLGLEAHGVVVADGRPAHFAILAKVGETPDNRPRATGVPAKRPLW